MIKEEDENGTTPVGLSPVQKVTDKFQTKALVGIVVVVTLIILAKVFL